jgi:hypothetical protein
MKVTLSKEELTILNKALGYLQDMCDDGLGKPHVDDLIESDKFLELNEKIAELMAEAKE